MRMSEVRHQNRCFFSSLHHFAAANLLREITLLTSSYLINDDDQRQLDALVAGERRELLDINYQNE